MSIFLEAIQRFVEPQEVTQPKLILIVGCLGLASNVAGLFLFHDHGHSHGGGGHSHGEEDGHSHGHSHDAISSAEEGHAGHAHAHAEDAQAADESGNVADVLPQNRIGGWPKTAPQKSNDTASPGEEGAQRQTKHKKTRSRSRTYSSVDDLPVNPSSFRQSIIAQSKLEDIEGEEATDEEHADQEHDHRHSVTSGQDQPLLQNGNGKAYGAVSQKPKLISHQSHKHKQPREAAGGGGHGHSHGDLNMRGVFLHVLGDALGNVGVIASALFIWLTDFSWRFYADPAISLIITIIILGSAIPLCKAASRILLQAVPAGLSVDDIKEDIEDLPGIISCHHLHVWQLSDTKLVASLHVQVGFNFKDEGSARYMELARAIRECLHEYGIHSSTIQPEFCLDPDHDHAAQADGTDTRGQAESSGDSAAQKTLKKQASKIHSVHDAEDECLLECGDACGGDKSCCPPQDAKNGASHDDHDDHAGHSH